jgi:hypothetical protein
LYLCQQKSFSFAFFFESLVMLDFLLDLLKGKLFSYPMLNSCAGNPSSQPEKKAGTFIQGFASTGIGPTGDFI